MKQNRTKHVYFSLFNPLKVTEELQIESLGWVHGGELGGGKLAMGWNRYKPNMNFDYQFFGDVPIIQFFRFYDLTLRLSWKG